MEKIKDQDVELIVANGGLAGTIATSILELLDLPEDDRNAATFGALASSLVIRCAVMDIDPADAVTELLEQTRDPSSSWPEVKAKLMEEVGSLRELRHEAAQKIEDELISRAAEAGGTVH